MVQLTPMTTYQSELLQAKYNRLLELTSKQRYYQSQYERFRCSKDRDNARRYGYEVDKIIKEEIQARQAKQNEIF